MKKHCLCLGLAVDFLISSSSAASPKVRLEGVQSSDGTLCNLPEKTLSSVVIPPEPLPPPWGKDDHYLNELLLTA